MPNLSSEVSTGIPLHQLFRTQALLPGSWVLQWSLLVQLAGDSLQQPGACQGAGSGSVVLVRRHVASAGRTGECGQVVCPSRGAGGRLCLYRHELSKLTGTRPCAKHRVPTWPDPGALQENAT